MEEESYFLELIRYIHLNPLRAGLAADLKALDRYLMLETPQGNLSEIMQNIDGAYTTYFNVKRKWAGHLFQGRYKAILVEADEYAAELSRYIQLNPVRAGAENKPEQYRWSSYCAFIGDATIPGWLKTDFILACFSQQIVTARKKYCMFVEELLGKEYESSLGKTFGSAILGTETFIEEITQTHIDGIVPDRNLPALRQFAVRPSSAEVVRTVKSLFGDNEKLVRNANIHIYHKYSGLKLKEIGDFSQYANRQFQRQAEGFSRSWKMIRN